MHVFSLRHEQEYNPKRRVEKILGRGDASDVPVACSEPGQISPYRTGSKSEADAAYFRRHPVCA